MNIFERFEIWFACRKIDLGKWLNDSSKSYRTTYNAERQRFETTAVGPLIMNGTPEWDAEQLKIKAIQERHQLRCAMDPAYKLESERKLAAYRAKAELSYPKK